MTLEGRLYSLFFERDGPLERTKYEDAPGVHRIRKSDDIEIAESTPRLVFTYDSIDLSGWVNPEAYLCLPHSISSRFALTCQNLGCFPTIAIDCRDMYLAFRGKPNKNKTCWKKRGNIKTWETIGGQNEDEGVENVGS